MTPWNVALPSLLRILFDVNGRTGGLAYATE